MADFRSTAKLEVLRVRADLLRRTRALFDSRGFVEVQTPLLSADTVVDRHLDPVPVLLPHDARNLNSGRQMWLQTSPEFAMKRLLASGLEAIYQITPVFRIGEQGALHQPEFTLLEWYRCGDTMREGIWLLSEIVATLLGRPAATVRTISQAFLEYAGFDALHCEVAELQHHGRSAQLDIPDSLAEDDWDAWFDLLFVHLVQPNLGGSAPQILHDYPASQAALAQIRRDTPPVAERFELFVDGVELANGYHELRDPDELAERNQRTNHQRVEDGKCELPVESRLLEAMRAGLPACCGVALGFDRLVMLSVGAERIEEVICFPLGRA